ncbi:MAG TPA: carbohydrate porin [Stellaceae bacterium]|nr:carbohydrate porin [Stellaceae bacterium]
MYGIQIMATARRLHGRQIGQSRVLRPLIAIVIALWPLPAAAQTATGDQTPTPAGLWERSNLLGDIGGLRPVLQNVGLTFNLQEISEILGNATGGIHTGADYDGLTTASLSLDTDKAFQWSGGTFDVSALQIHGRDLSTDNLATLQTASGIEASRTTRLWELWYQQAFFDSKADIKLGQQSVDQEFIGSQYAGLFVNTMMGWPMLPSANLFAGGPAYPLSSPGARVRARPSDALTVLAGVFDDNPPGGPFNDDPQLRGAEASGTKFNLGGGALWLGELQYAANATPAKDCGNLGCGLPGTYKLGGWYDSGSFLDQRFDTNGVSLASPASNGLARRYRGNFSIYGIIDQMVWRQPDGPRSVGVFVRAMGAPADRNLIDASLNAGVSLKAPLAGRDNDTFSIGYGWAHVSGRASALDQDTARVTGTAFPVRSAEHFIEVTYQYQLAPWWQLQPDFQYVINPGGGIQNPQHTSQIVGDEAVFGLRTTITF